MQKLIYNAKLIENCISMFTGSYCIISFKTKFNLIFTILPYGNIWQITSIKKISLQGFRIWFKIHAFQITHHKNLNNLKRQMLKFKWNMRFSITKRNNKVGLNFGASFLFCFFNQILRQFFININPSTRYRSLTRTFLDH